MLVQTPTLAQLPQPLATLPMAKPQLAQLKASQPLAQLPQLVLQPTTMVLKTQLTQTTLLLTTTLVQTILQPLLANNQQTTTQTQQLKPLQPAPLQLLSL